MTRVDLWIYSDKETVDILDSADMIDMDIEITLEALLSKLFDDDLNVTVKTFIDFDKQGLPQCFGSPNRECKECIWLKPCVEYWERKKEC